MRGRTRTLVGIGAVALLVMAVPAVASAKHFSGTTAGGGTVAFNAKVHKGKLEAVKNFLFDAVPMQCDDGSHTITNAGFAVKPIHIGPKRRFHGSRKSDSGQITESAKGKLSKNLRSASGTLRVTGDYAPPVTNCETGAVHWHAS